MSKKQKRSSRKWALNRRSRGFTPRGTQFDNPPKGLNGMGLAALGLNGMGLAALGAIVGALRGRSAGRGE